jgi:hypothetical protein
LKLSVLINISRIILAKYNGELVSQTLKVVEPSTKPADYEYGAVSQVLIESFETATL